MSITFIKISRYILIIMGLFKNFFKNKEMLQKTEFYKAKAELLKQKNMIKDRKEARKAKEIHHIVRNAENLQDLKESLGEVYGDDNISKILNHPLASAFIGKMMGVEGVDVSDREKRIMKNTANPLKNVDEAVIQEGLKFLDKKLKN